MSSEDLVKRIQDGEAEAVIELWENVRRFIHLQAYRYHVFSGGLYEIEDLEQAGFIAMIQSANNYRPGESSFVNYLSLHLKKEFALTYNGSRKKIPPLTSLDQPLDDDDNTLEDITPDPADPYEETERRIFLEQLQQQLNRSIEQLPEDQKKIILARYYDGLTLTAAAAFLDTPAPEIRKKELKALEKLRKDKALEQFIDEQTPFYYHIGIKTFLSEHESAVEKIVMKRELMKKKIDSTAPRGAD